MFQFKQQQMNALQRHANGCARKKLLATLREEGVSVQEIPGTDDLLVQDHNGGKSRFLYRSDMLISDIVRPSGKTIKFDYENSAHLKSVEYPGGVTHEFNRNAIGQVTALTISGRYKYSLQYDEANLLSSIQYPDNRSVGFQWGKNGVLGSFIDRCGNAIRFNYTSMGASVTDSLGRQRFYRTDHQGCLDALIFPDATLEQFAFNQDENVVEVIQRNGSQIHFQLSDQGSPSKISWQDGTELNLSFDDKDRLVAAKTGDVEVTRVFNAQGLVAAEGTSNGTVEYQYDPNGRMISYTTPFGDKVEFEYDEDGLLIGVSDWENRPIQIEYAGNDTPSRIRFPNGVNEDLAVLSTPYRASTNLLASTGFISEHRIEADDCERVRRVVDRWGNQPCDCLDRCLAYDNEDRLVAENISSDGTPFSVFAYDAAGNMIQDNGCDIAFAAMDQPIRRGDETIDYDSLGNVSRLTTSHGPVNATYTEDNRLRGLSSNGREYRYEYDGLCRRIRKTDGKESWIFGWSGSQLLWEIYKSSPEVESIRRDYLYLPNSSTPIAFRESGKTYWIQSDFRGAVIAVHDEDGAVVWRGVYESFGACKTLVNKIRQPWRLAGQYYDDESGLHYNLARYYCPTNKTYLSLDPRWQEPEATNYSYARNDPWNRADPLGMLAPLLIGAIGIGVAGIIGGAIGAYQAPPGEKASAFGKGFLVGAGAATVGVLAALALPKIGIAATAVAGLAVIGAVEGMAGSIITDLLAGDPICFSCALISAGVGAALGVVLPFVGGFLARKLSPVLGKILTKIKNQPSKAKLKPPSTVRSQTAAETNNVAQINPPIRSTVGTPPASKAVNQKATAITSKKPPRTFRNASEMEIHELGSFEGMKRSDIQKLLKDRGYRMTKNGNSKIFTKDMGDGTTAAVRLDPANRRNSMNPEKSHYSDTKTHAHKEVVPTNRVNKGNYPPDDKVNRYDDKGELIPGIGKPEHHIPVGTRRGR